MIVRDAAAEDAERIARVHYDTWMGAYAGLLPDSYLKAQSYERRRDAWEAHFARRDPQTVTGVAVDPKAGIVGFASAGPERSGEPVFHCELYALYVLPGHHGRGTGTALVRWTAERLIERGHTAMLVWTLAEGPSGRFYERLGGTLHRAGTRDFAGVAVPLVAYGWADLRALPGCPER